MPFDRSGFGDVVFADASMGIHRSSGNEASPGTYYIEFFDLAVVQVVISEMRVTVAVDRPMVPESTVRHLLLDQVYPRILSADGQLILHAGANLLDDRAIIIVGPSGRGKSTLCASLHNSGLPLMSDDAILTKGQGSAPAVQASYGSLRLLPDSFQEFFSVKTEQCPVAHYSAKQRLELYIKPIQEPIPHPLAAIFFLGETSPEQTVRIEPMSGSKVCMALISNSFALDPSDRARAQDRMKSAGTIANQVPAFQLIYPRDYSLLPEVREAILRTVEAIGGASADCR